MSFASVWAGSANGINHVGAGDLVEAVTTRDAVAFGAGYGAWQELIAPQPVPMAGLVLVSSMNPSASLRAVLSLGLGPSGSEVEVMPGLNMSSAVSGTSLHGHGIFVPLAIPANTRVAVRWATSETGTAVSRGLRLGATGIPASPRWPVGPRQWTHLGWNPSTWSGVASSSGASSMGRGAWVELSSSAPHDGSMGLLVLHRITAAGSVRVVVDLAIGSAGSEVTILSNVPVNANSSLISCTMVGPLPLRIPRGTRVAARSADSATAVQDVGISLLLGS